MREFQTNSAWDLMTKKKTKMKKKGIGMALPVLRQPATREWQKGKRTGGREG